MTESEWQRGKKRPDTMLGMVARQTSDRKLRLYVCACIRHVWYHLLTEAKSVRLLDLNEGYADGSARMEDLDAEALPILAKGLNSGIMSRGREDTPEQRVAVSAFLARTTGAVAARYFVYQLWLRRNEPERAMLCQLLREVIGNPFRPVTANPRWLTSPVLDLARTMYVSRDFGPMPILADALEEAGCDNSDVLAHCRGGGPHVRGCWVADLILGKA